MCGLRIIQGDKAEEMGRWATVATAKFLKAGYRRAVNAADGGRPQPRRQHPMLRCKHLQARSCYFLLDTRLHSVMPHPHPRNYSFCRSEEEEEEEDDDDDVECAGECYALKEKTLVQGLMYIYTHI